MSEINFVEVDAKKIEQDIINAFELALGETLYPGDERRVFLMQVLPIIIGQKNDINSTGRQNLLRYARAEVLDAIGERTDTLRVPEQKSKTTLRFTLSSAQSFNVIIPQGTRATPDGKLYFATTKALTILAGQAYGDVLAESVIGGQQYNGFTPGQIKTIVDPVPYVASVSNIDTSSGGSDVESDDNYRERIRQAPTRFSTAGPTDAYAFWAKSADVNIADVSVTSPNPGEVQITVLMADGQIPSQIVLDAVNASCNDRKRRPLTDLVTVSAPNTITYDINLTYYISQDRATEETSIRSAIESTGGAVDQFIKWQSAKLSRAINPDYLRKLMLDAGAFRINIVTPIYTEVADNEVASISSTITLNYGGLI